MAPCTHLYQTFLKINVSFKNKRSLFLLQRITFFFINFAVSLKFKTFTTFAPFLNALSYSALFLSVK